MKVLFLCTGNICRSPMAEAFLRHDLDERGVAARVISAGVTFDDRAASEGAMRVMASRGLSLADHRSRIMWPELLRSADLVLGMARVHIREAAVMAPDAFGRMLTLKEVVRRAQPVGPRNGAPLPDWLDEVTKGRVPADLLGDAALDDITDPIGRPLKFYEATAAEIGGLVTQLADLVWGPPPPPSARG